MSDCNHECLFGDDEENQDLFSTIQQIISTPQSTIQSDSSILSHANSSSYYSHPTQSVSFMKFERGKLDSKSRGNDNSPFTLPANNAQNILHNKPQSLSLLGSNMLNHSDNNDNTAFLFDTAMSTNLFPHHTSIHISHSDDQQKDFHLNPLLIVEESIQDPGKDPKLVQNRHNDINLTATIHPQCSHVSQSSLNSITHRLSQLDPPNSFRKTQSLSIKRKNSTSEPIKRIEATQGIGWPTFSSTRINGTTLPQPSLWRYSLFETNRRSEQYKQYKNELKIKYAVQPPLPSSSATDLINPHVSTHGSTSDPLNSPDEALRKVQNDDEKGHKISKTLAQLRPKTPLSHSFASPNSLRAPILRRFRPHEPLHPAIDTAFEGNLDPMYVSYLKNEHKRLFNIYTAMCYASHLENFILDENGYIVLKRDCGQECDCTTDKEDSSQVIRGLKSRDVKNHNNINHHKTIIFDRPLSHPPEHNQCLNLKCPKLISFQKAKDSGMELTVETKKRAQELYLQRLHALLLHDADSITLAALDTLARTAHPEVLSNVNNSMLDTQSAEVGTEKSIDNTPTQPNLLRSGQETDWYTRCQGLLNSTNPGIYSTSTNTTSTTPPLPRLGQIRQPNLQLTKQAQNTSFKLELSVSNPTTTQSANTKPKVANIKNTTTLTHSDYNIISLNHDMRSIDSQLMHSDSLPPYRTTLPLSDRSSTTLPLHFSHGRQVVRAFPRTQQESRNLDAGKFTTPMMRMYPRDAKVLSHHYRDLALFFAKRAKNISKSSTHRIRLHKLLTSNASKTTLSLKLPDAPVHLGPTSPSHENYHAYQSSQPITSNLDNDDFNTDNDLECYLNKRKRSIRERMRLLSHDHQNNFSPLALVFPSLNPEDNLAPLLPMVLLPRDVNTFNNRLPKLNTSIDLVQHAQRFNYLKQFYLYHADHFASLPGVTKPLIKDLPSNQFDQVDHCETTNIPLSQIQPPFRSSLSPYPLPSSIPTSQSDVLIDHSSWGTMDQFHLELTEWYTNSLTETLNPPQCLIPRNDYLREFRFLTNSKIIQRELYDRSIQRDALQREIDTSKLSVGYSNNISPTPPPDPPLSIDDCLVQLIPPAYHPQAFNFPTQLYERYQAYTPRLGHPLDFAEPDHALLLIAYMTDDNALTSSDLHQTLWVYQTFRDLKLVQRDAAQREFYINTISSRINTFADVTHGPQCDVNIAYEFGNGDGGEQCLHRDFDQCSQSSCTSFDNENENSSVLTESRESSTTARPREKAHFTYPIPMRPYTLLNNEPFTQIHLPSKASSKLNSLIVSDSSSLPLDARLAAKEAQIQRRREKEGLEYLFPNGLFHQDYVLPKSVATLPISTTIRSESFRGALVDAYPLQMKDGIEEVLQTNDPIAKKTWSKSNTNNSSHSSQSLPPSLEESNHHSGKKTLINERIPHFTLTWSQVRLMTKEEIKAYSNTMLPEDRIAFQQDLQLLSLIEERYNTKFNKDLDKGSQQHSQGDREEGIPLFQELSWNEDELSLDHHSFLTSPSPPLNKNENNRVPVTRRSTTMNTKQGPEKKKLMGNADHLKTWIRPMKQLSDVPMDDKITKDDFYSMLFRDFEGCGLDNWNYERSFELGKLESKCVDFIRHYRTDVSEFTADFIQDFPITGAGWIKQHKTDFRRLYSCYPLYTSSQLDKTQVIKPTMLLDQVVRDITTSSSSPSTINNSQLYYEAANRYADKISDKPMIEVIKMLHDGPTFDHMWFHSQINSGDNDSTSQYHQFLRFWGWVCQRIGLDVHNITSLKAALGSISTLNSIASSLNQMIEKQDAPVFNPLRAKLSKLSSKAGPNNNYPITPVVSVPQSTGKIQGLVITPQPNMKNSFQLLQKNNSAANLHARTSLPDNPGKESVSFSVPTASGTIYPLCPRCDRPITNALNHRTQHELYDNPSTQHRCEECQVGFSSQPKLVAHLTRVHNLGREATCNQCNVYVPQYMLQRHMKLHAQYQMPDTFKCDICRYGYLVPFGLQNHMRLHEIDTPVTAVEGQMGVESHQQSTDTMNNDNNRDETISDQISTTESTVAATTTTSKEPSHSTSTTNTKHLIMTPIIQAPRRSTSIRDQRSTSTHTTGVRSTRVQNAQAQASQIKLERFNDPKVPFKCYICQSGFEKRNELNTHTYNLHRGPVGSGGFTCPRCQCPTTFTDAVRHMRWHDLWDQDLTPYQCVTCELAFEFDHSYRSHMRLFHPKTINSKDETDVDEGDEDDGEGTEWNILTPTTLSPTTSLVSGKETFDTDIKLSMVALDLITTDLTSPIGPTIRSHQNSTPATLLKSPSSSQFLSLNTTSMKHNDPTATSSLGHTLGDNSNNNSSRNRNSPSEFSNTSLYGPIKHNRSLLDQPAPPPIFGKTPRLLPNLPTGSCKLCHSQFGDKAHQEAHQLFHTKDGHIKCDICLIAFSVSKPLNKHIRTMHAYHAGPTTKAIPCKRCKKWIEPGSLVRHNEMHLQFDLSHQTHPYRCEPCQLAFKSSITLNYHLKTHQVLRDQVEYLCGICNLTSQPSKLIYHQRLHGLYYEPGQEISRCNICLIGFDSPTVHAHHVRHVHPEAGVVTCKNCLTLFNNDQEYHDHMASHGGLRNTLHAGYFHQPNLPHPRSVLSKEHLMRTFNWDNLMANSRHQSNSIANFDRFEYLYVDAPGKEDNLFCLRCNQYVFLEDLDIHKTQHRLFEEKGIQWKCLTCFAGFNTVPEIDYHDKLMHSPYMILDSDEEEDGEISHDDGKQNDNGSNSKGNNDNIDKKKTAKLHPSASTIITTTRASAMGDDATIRAGGCQGGGDGDVCDEDDEEENVNAMTSPQKKKIRKSRRAKFTLPSESTRTYCRKCCKYILNTLLDSHSSAHDLFALKTIQYKCQYCRFGFHSTHALDVHNAAVHPELLIPSPLAITISTTSATAPSTSTIHESISRTPSSQQLPAAPATPSLPSVSTAPTRQQTSTRTGRQRNVVSYSEIDHPNDENGQS